MTTPHRFVPISRPWDYDGESEWRCVGCSLVRRDPAAKLTDDCQALSMLDESA